MFQRTCIRGWRRPHNEEIAAHATHASDIQAQSLFGSFDRILYKFSIVK